MTDEERKTVKEGRVPEDWKSRPAKLRHKDRDARWTVKFTKAKERPDGTKPPVDIAIPSFGYQNHVAIDVGHGFIHLTRCGNRRLLRCVYRGVLRLRAARCARCEHEYSDQSCDHP